GTPAEAKRPGRVPGGPHNGPRDGADDERGRGDPRPLRCQPQDRGCVQRDDDQERNLALPLVAKAGTGDETVQAQVSTAMWRYGEDLLDDVLRWHQGQDRRVDTEAQEPGRPAAARGPENPAGPQGN